MTDGCGPIPEDRQERLLAELHHPLTDEEADPDPWAFLFEHRHHRPRNRRARTSRTDEGT